MGVIGVVPPLLLDEEAAETGDPRGSLAEKVVSVSWNASGQKGQLMEHLHGEKPQKRRKKRRRSQEARDRRRRMRMMAERDAAAHRKRTHCVECPDEAAERRLGMMTRNNTIVVD